MESTTGQTLSPEAAVFVPRQGPVSVSGPYPLQQIPTYMTNCYPFVQDNERARAGWNRGPRLRRHPGPKQARNIPGFSGNRFPGPHNFGPPVHTFPVGHVDSPWASPVLPVAPLINNLFPASDSTVTGGNDGEFRERHNLPKYPNSSRRQWRTSSRNDSESSQDNLPNSSEQFSSPFDAQTDISSDSWHGSKGQKVSRRGGRGRKKEWQKEEQYADNRAYAHGNRNNNHRKDLHRMAEPDAPPCVPFAGGHTIIVKETSVQTDFPDSYADLTLMSHPSTLYLPYLGESRNKSRSHSDSDVDSDSGYNSPLHKRNGLLNSPFVSVGTLSMTHVVNVAQTPDSIQSNSYSQPKDVNSNDAVDKDIASSVMPSQPNESPQKFSYAFVAKKKPVPQSSNSEPEKMSKPDSSQERNKNQTLEKEKTSRKNRRSKSSKDSIESKPASKHQPLSGHSDQSQADDKKENTEDGEGEGKKKRKRKRKRKKKKKDGDESDGGAMKDSIPEKEVELHFEDEEEFPDLMASTASGSNKTGGATVPLLSYSAMLKSSTLRKVQDPPDTNEILSSPPEEIKEEGPQEGELELVSKSKNGKRRRRRQEMLHKAADEELAEISLEQQMLRELNLKPKQKGFGKDVQTPGILKVNQQPQASGKKSKQAVSLDLSAMIDALEKKKTDVPKKIVNQKVVKKRNTPKAEDKPGLGHNLLDSSAPMKRGKERENPKPKKPSSLKKVILKEREEKKKLKLLDDSESHNSGSLGLGIVCGNESDLSQDGMSVKSMNEYSCVGTPASNDLSPVSQTSPISMSPLSPGVSPQSSEVNSPIAGIIGKEVRMKIHSRRFREYCNQVLNKDIDNCCTELLKDLVRFQDRMYHKDPTKAKSKRRIVLGLREVTKHLKLKKIKCVIISPNLEKIQSKGGLDDALNNILNLCNEQNTPFVFALGRRALGRACAKLVPVSVVGIFNYEGSNENFLRLMELSELARQSYKEMVSVIEKEIRDYPTLGAAAAVPHIYAHMGHSRTPSGASVLSFTSSILSEPISENYPHSEPETDSKGYEIVKEGSNLDNLNKVACLKMRDAGMQELKSKMIYPGVNVDIDDGNEADTEEYEQRRMDGQGRLPSNEDYSRDEDSEGSSEEGSDTVKALPHIDSIHSSMQELNTEILSQHSGRNNDNCDAISTHSSRTLGDGSSTILADAGERSRHDTPKSAGSPSSTLQRGKVIDAERIQNWVHQTQSRLENLQQSQEDSAVSSDTGSESDNNDHVEDIETNCDQIKPHSDGHSQTSTSHDQQYTKCVDSEHSAKCKGSESSVTSDEGNNCPSTGTKQDNMSSNNVANAATTKQDNVHGHLPAIEESSELVEPEVSLNDKATTLDIDEVKIAINT